MSAKSIHIALVGNPNSGKSSLFNVLTGMNQKVGNFPGVTIDKKKGNTRLDAHTNATIIDLPGTYTLYPNSEDESITCQVIWNTVAEERPDLWVVVADATQLRRSLLLCSQMIDLGLPTMMVLNMMDLIENSEQTINIAKLSQHLQIPILPVSARQNQGVEELKKAFLQIPVASKKRFLIVPEGFHSIIEEIEALLQTNSVYMAWQAILIPQYFPEEYKAKLTEIQQKSGVSEPKALIANEMLIRYERIDMLLADSVKTSTTRAEKLSTKIDSIVLHPILGYAFFLFILLFIFQALFSWAELPMEWIDGVFSFSGNWMQSHLPDAWWSRLWVEGIWAGIGGIVVFVPQIAALFFFIALLEESGYMSRVVFLMDKIMRPFGFSGKSVIPLIGGMACAVPAIMMARTISDKRERLITILVTPLMSCSARLPVYVLLISMFVPAQPGWLQGIVMTGMYLLGFVMALLAAFVFKKVLKYNSDGVFVSEIPLYRMPRWQNVGLTIWQKSKAFVVDAGKVILVISIALWFLSSYGPEKGMQAAEAKYKALVSAQPQASDSLKAEWEIQKNSEKLANSYAGKIGHFMEPAIRPLGFDWKIGIALLTSFAAREVFVGTMATIYQVSDAEGNIQHLRKQLKNETNLRTGKPQYTPVVAISLLVFYAFAMQCMSTLAATYREAGGWKWTIVMLLYLTALAYGASLFVYQVFG